MCARLLLNANIKGANLASFCLYETKAQFHHALNFVDFEVECSIEKTISHDNLISWAPMIESS